MQSHKEYLAYSVIDGDKIYDLPTYILFLQREQAGWMKTLKDAVTSVLPFKGNLDPEKGMVGVWVHTYETKDEALVKLIKQVGKYNAKLMKTAATINEQDDSKGKNKYLGKSMGPSIRIQQTMEKVHSHVTPIYKALDNRKTEKFHALDQSSVKINLSLDRLISGAEKEMATALENSESSKKNGVVFLISLTVGAVVLAIVLGLYLSRYLTRSITALAEVTQDVSDGNLQKTVDISSRDELGDLANSTNAMTENLRQIIQKISAYSQDLTNASVDLTSLSTSMSASAENMTLKSESVAAAAEQMSSNMNTVAKGAGEATNNINTVSISTEEINASISEIAKNSEIGSAVAQEAVEKAKSATERMNELGAAAQGISKVTEVISEISDNMGHASAGLRDVSDNVAESTNVSNEIAKDIGDVFTSSNEVLTESGHVSTSSENLKKLADGLQELISRFKI